MQTKVKQLVVNMWNQITIVLRPFFDFMDCSKLVKAHNMLAFMLDPWLKYLKTILFGDQNMKGNFQQLPI